MPPERGAVLVRFWGTRGSIPVAMTSAEVKRKLVAALVKGAGRGLDTTDKARAFVEEELDFTVSHTFGGNSSCVQIDNGHADYVLCDLGSGARMFGNSVLAARGPTGHRFHVLMSHVHWDHIMGFPFFMPAYIPGNHVRIYGCHDTLEEAFRRQNAAPSFPVDFSRMGPASSSSGSTSGATMTSRGCVSAPSGSTTAAIPTATAWRGRARWSSIPPTPSTSRTIPRRSGASWSSSVTPIW
jgi:phosphoribosyl 1,2-cyclic phosphodiesterase